MNYYWADNQRSFTFCFILHFAMVWLSGSLKGNINQVEAVDIRGCSSGAKTNAKPISPSHKLWRGSILLQRPAASISSNIVKYLE